MLEALPLLATTIGFISIFLYIFSTIQLHDIRENWEARRCEPLVMLIAQLVPDPKDTSVDRSTFAADNFSFCLNKIIDASIAGALTPVMGVFSKQMDAAKPIQESINTLKTAASNAVTNPINMYVNTLWKQFGYVLYQFGRIFLKFNSAFQRIFGIVLSSLFAGMAMFRGILNAKNFVVKVCVILLNIIIALLFILFIPLLPFIPIIILPVIAAVSAAGGSTGGMADAFNCVEPGTLVACRDTWKPVEELVEGDKLRSGIVTGILKGFPGGKCVKIDGVVISGLHIVYDNKVKKWVYASDHTQAIPCDSPELVYCITTTSGKWTVKTDSDELLLRDWNDIPTDPSSDDEFEMMVDVLLNGSHSRKTGEKFRGISIINEDSLILNKETGYIQIRDVCLGDMIHDGEEFTRVLGIYKGRREGVRAGMNDSGWIWEQTRQRWVHPILKSDISYVGYTLVTQSGIYYADGKIRRDITEVGATNLYKTGASVLSLLNNRNDEEECFSS